MKRSVYSNRLDRIKSTRASAEEFIASEMKLRLAARSHEIVDFPEYHFERVSRPCLDTGSAVHVLDRSNNIVSTHKNTHHGAYTKHKFPRYASSNVSTSTPDTKTKQQAQVTVFSSLLQECSTCVEQFLFLDIVRLQACQHKSEVCRGCHDEYLKTRIENSLSLTRIPCIAGKCSTYYTPEEIESIVSKETYDVYDHRLTRELLREDPAFRWCAGPSCGSGQIHDSDAEDDDIFRCQECDYLHCVACDLPMHTGESCEEYHECIRLDSERAAEAKEREEEEELSRAQLEKNSKKCPGVDCAYSIQKTAGCDHMTCSRCMAEFCYVCLALYDGPTGIWEAGNSAHMEDCAHYRAHD